MIRTRIRYTDVVIATLQAPIDDWYVAALLEIQEAEVVHHRKEVYGFKTSAKPLSIDSLSAHRRKHADKRAREEQRKRSIEYEYPTDPEWYRRRTIFTIAADLKVTPYDAYRHVIKHRYPYIPAQVYRKFTYPDDPEWYATRTLSEMVAELRIPRNTLRQHMKREGYTWKSE